MENGKIYFYTCSIYNWIPILDFVPCQNIILNSLSFLVEKQAVKVLGFVVMPNHLHFIWKPIENKSITNLQLSFMRFTAQKIKFWLIDENPEELRKFLVNKKDREYQVWQRNPLAIELYTPKVLEQKLDYIHNNPCQGKWMLAQTPLDYPLSSFAFYEKEETHFSFLSHYREEI